MQPYTIVPNCFNKFLSNHPFQLYSWYLLLTHSHFSLDMPSIYIKENLVLPNTKIVIQHIWSCKLMMRFPSMITLNQGSKLWFGFVAILDGVDKCGHNCGCSLYKSLGDVAEIAVAACFLETFKTWAG